MWFSPVKPTTERIFYNDQNLDLLRSYRDALRRENDGEAETFAPELERVGDKRNALVAGHGGFQALRR